MAIPYRQYPPGATGNRVTPPRFTTDKSGNFNQHALANMGYLASGSGRYVAAPGALPLNSQQKIQAAMLAGGGRSTTDSLAPAQLVGPGFGKPSVAPSPFPQQQTDPFQQWMQQQYATNRQGASGWLRNASDTNLNSGMMGTGSPIAGDGFGAGAIPPPLPGQFSQQVGQQGPAIPLNEQMKLYQQSVRQNKAYDEAEKLRIEAAKKERKRLQDQLLQQGPYFAQRRPPSSPANFQPASLDAMLQRQAGGRASVPIPF